MRVVRPLFVSLVVVCCMLVAAADKRFTMPETRPAAEYPAHDAHPMEKVTIAADPYDNKDKQKIFSADYLGHRLLPVFLVVTNNGDVPVSLVEMKLQLLTRDRAKAPPANSDDLYRRFTDNRRLQDKSSGTKRLPLPIPLPKGENGVPSKLRDEFDQSQFWAKAVEPHGSQSGFVFFDIGDLQDPARGATITVTGVKDGNGNDLMYFEIALDKGK